MGPSWTPATLVSHALPPRTQPVHLYPPHRTSTHSWAFCLSSLCDLSHVTISVAYAAAQRLWPDRVVGPPLLYVDKARPILPALSDPHQAVVLVRLLADEGVIGASCSYYLPAPLRNTAGARGRRTRGDALVYNDSGLWPSEASLQCMHPLHPIPADIAL